MGHSVGEYVAAFVAGVFSVEDALRLVAARGRLMQGLPGGGGMAAVMAGEGRVREAMAPYGDALSLAAVNGAESVVISGRVEEVGRGVSKLEGEGIRTKRVVVSHAVHSRLMEAVAGDLEAEGWGPRGNCAWRGRPRTGQGSIGITRGARSGCPRIPSSASAAG